METVREIVEEYCLRTETTEEELASRLDMTVEEFEAKLDGHDEFLLSDAAQLADALGVTIGSMKDALALLMQPGRGSIRVERLLRGWTLEDVAEAVGVDPDLLVKWENGEARPSKEAATRLCALYEIAPEALFGTAQTPGELADAALHGQKDRRLLQIKAIYHSLDDTGRDLLLEEAKAIERVLRRHRDAPKDEDA